MVDEGYDLAVEKSKHPTFPPRLGIPHNARDYSLTGVVFHLNTPDSIL